MNEDVTETGRARVVLHIVLFFAAALLLGALCAPHVFNLTVHLGRQWPALERLRDVEFEKVANRCVLIALLLAIIPALKVGGLTSLERLGLKAGVPWAKQVAMGWVVGAVMIAGIFVAGLLTKAYTVEGGWSADVLAKVLVYFIGALVVSLIEEPLFRGAVFGLLRKGFGVFVGSMVASVIFAAVHFASPEPAVGVVHGRWNSGLYLLRYMFTSVDLRWGFGFMFITLFLLGMTLCLLYQHFGNLYVAIGMHAGWIWAMRIGEYFFERNRTCLTMLFGPSMTMAKSGLAMLMAAAVLAVVAWLHVKKRNREGR